MFIKHQLSILLNLINYKGKDNKNTEKINEQQDKALYINNYMNYSHDDFSYFRNKNINLILKNKEQLENSMSETISDDVDELSVIRFMLERNFFDNSGNKLVGNMTFLNKIIEMSKDISLNNNHSKHDMKQNLKQVVEYLMENKSPLNKENLDNPFIKKLSNLNFIFRK